MQPNDEDSAAEAAYFNALSVARPRQPGGNFFIEDIQLQKERNLVPPSTGSHLDVQLAAVQMESVRQDQRISIMEDAMRQMQVQMSQVLQLSVSAGNLSEDLRMSQPDAKNNSNHDKEVKLSILQANQRDLEKNIAEFLPRLAKLEESDDERRHATCRETFREDEGEKDMNQQSSTKALNSLADIEEQVYTMNESIWDASMLVGLPVLGKGATSIILLDLCFLVLMVFIFIGIIIVNFADADSYSDTVKSQLYHWRHDVGHRLQFSDGATGSSMTARVCAQDAGMDGSYNQFNYVGNLQAYLPDFSGECDSWCTISNVFFSGPSLSIMAIAVWHMTVWPEIVNALSMFKALFHFDVTSHTQVIINREKISVKTLSRGRKLYGFTMVIVKMTLNIMLLISGFAFLVHTVNLQNLLLNALALQFVLYLDQMVYAALAPSRVCTFIEHCEGLPTYGWPCIAGVEILSILAPLITFGVVVFIHFVYLGPFLRRLNSILDVVCGGNLDFVFQADAVGVLWAVRSPTFGSPLSQVEQWQVDTVKELVTGYDHATTIGTQANFDAMWPNSRALNYHAMVALKSERSFRTESHYDPSSLLERTNMGTDLPIMLQLRRLMDNNSNSLSCSHLVHFRRNDAPSCYLKYEAGKHSWGSNVAFSSMVRATCKKGCGCTSPYWGTLYKEYAGCPGVLHSQSYQDDLSFFNCTDISEKDIDNPTMVQWFQNFFLPNPELTRPGVVWPDAFAVNSSFCSVAYQIFGHLATSWPAVCPVTWGCATGQFQHVHVRPYCPLKCPCNLLTCIVPPAKPPTQASLDGRLQEANHGEHDLPPPDHPGTR